MNDLRLAIRQFLKSPAFSAVVVVTLGLGIGACTLVFSWIRTLLIDTVPGAREPGRLVVLAQRHVSGAIYDTLSRLDIDDLAEATSVFAGVIGSQFEAVTLRTGQETEWVWAQTTTANYFDVLGVRPVLGRGFLPGEDKAPRGNAVAVLSHGLWKRRFNGDPDAIGKTIEIGRRPFTVVGVAPPSFRGTMGGLGFDLWIPITMSSEHEDVGEALAGRNWRWLHTIGRLQPGVGIPQAQAAVDTVMRRTEAAYPGSNRNVGVIVLPVWKSPWGAQSALLPLLTALGGVAGLLLVLVIANVANLLLARATAREGEMAIRAALGAKGYHLVRQMLTESLVLAAVGGTLGCLLSAALARALLWLLPPTYLPIRMDFSLDGRALAFTAAVTLITGIAFGLFPAWRARRAVLADALKAGGRSGTGSRETQRLRQALVVAEIAGALVLLVAMTLCARSFERARRIDVGLDTSSVWVAGFRLPPGSFSADEAAQFYTRLRTNLEGLPGVRSVALADWLPLGFEGGSSTGFAVPGYTPAPGENVNAVISQVTPGYFETLRIVVTSGRGFDARDHRTAPPVVVINEELGRRYYPGRDPVGLGIDLWGHARTIVGVVRTGKYRSLSEAPRSCVYLPVDQTQDHTLAAIVRTAGSTAGVAAAIERAALAIDPTVKPLASMPMTEYVGAAYLIPRTAAVLLAALGAVAVLLSILGIYAVIAWSVGRRTREVGLRMALGAGRREIVWLFVREGGRLVMWGGGIGLLAAVAAGRVLRSLLVDTSAWDPATYLVAPLVLATVALAACWLPARKAGGVDPSVALRAE